MSGPAGFSFVPGGPPNRAGVASLRLVGLILAGAALSVGCSSGGFLKPANPTGQFQIRELGTSTYAVTSPSSPLPVHGSFSLAISEQNYSAQFQVTIASYTGPVVKPCYSPTMDSTGTIATFSLQASLPIGGSSGSTSPCALLGDDVEGALIEDQRGNKALVYFENAPNILAPGMSEPITAIFAAGGPTPGPTAASTTVPFAGTFANPVPVDNGFTVALSEIGVPTTFTAYIVSYTAAAQKPCYSVQMDPTGRFAIFSPQSTSPLAPSPAPSACLLPNSDIEGVLFEDTLGNVLEEFFKNTATPPPAPTPTPTATPTP